MTIYEAGDGRKATLTEAMGTSTAFIGIVTSNYVEDIRNKDTRIMKELQTCKDFKVPVILLFFDNLTVEDRKLAEEFFKNYHVIRTYDVPYQEDKFQAWLQEHNKELERTVIEAAGP